MIERTCRACGRPFEIRNFRAIDPLRGKYCSEPCYREGRKAGRIERFWSNVAKRSTRECWLWKGPMSRTTGYGLVTHRISVGHGESKGAHRYSWEITNGPIPEGLMVCHSCDVKLCVNPAHLFIGTGSDNVQDALKKGIMQVGDRHYMKRNPSLIRKGEQLTQSKLTEKDVRDIRSSSLRSGLLAKAFGVDRHTIARIRKGRDWKHVK